MDQNTVGLIVVAAMSLAGILWTQYVIKRNNDRTTDVAKDKVSQDAYDRARDADKDTIANLRAEVQRERELRGKDQEQVQREIERLERQVDALRVDLSSSSRENLRLLEHIDRLEATVARLRARLAVAGLMDERRPDPSGDPT